MANNPVSDLWINAAPYPNTTSTTTTTTNSDTSYAWGMADVSSTKSEHKIKTLRAIHKIDRMFESEQTPIKAIEICNRLCAELMEELQTEVTITAVSNHYEGTVEYRAELQIVEKER